MTVIKDNELGGLLMIPIWEQYNLHRCNVRGCKNKQRVFIPDLAEQPFALCEHHYNEFKSKGEINCILDFD